MELREWAIRILSADRIEEKLLDPISFTDEKPGAPLLWQEPTRPKNMIFTKHTRAGDKLPSFQEHHKSENIAVCLHRFCGHELLAVEIMAYVLLAFPESPPSFRKGVAHTLREEQMHVRLYMDRMKELGLNFGDLPLFKHFWKHTPYLTSPIKYVSMMSLTFEMANLDFAPQYGLSFERNGDQGSSNLMRRIFSDEISHVRFGMKWFQQFKEKNADAFLSYQEAILPHLTPKRAKGFVFQKKARETASVPADWIAALEAL
ncbi:MAG: DUF455 family protein [Verrucomicrobia bacterium]|nr:DUF455 family protein [Verrucomicrobiota bacterium]